MAVMRIAILYLAAGLVMAVVMVITLLLGHMLVAAFAFVAGIAALLSAAGRLAAIRWEDPDQ
jgi:hypothetical protein